MTTARRLITCRYRISLFGDDALPYLERAIEQARANPNQSDPDNNTMGRIVGALAYLRSKEATGLLLRLAESDDRRIRQGAEYALVQRPLRPAAKLIYFRILKDHRYFDEICAASLRYKWQAMLPVLQEAMFAPSSLREYRVLLTTRRTLEDKAIPESLIVAENLIRKLSADSSAAGSKQLTEEAHRLLIESDVAEAANLIALSLAWRRFKVTQESRAAGLWILKSRPRASTLEFLRSLPNSLQETDREQVARIVEAVSKAPLPASN